MNSKTLNTFNLPAVIIPPGVDSSYLLYRKLQTFLAEFHLILLFSHFCFFFSSLFFQPFLYFFFAFIWGLCVLFVGGTNCFALAKHTQSINIGLSKQIRGAHFWMISASRPLEPAGMPRSQSLLETRHMKREREAEWGRGRKGERETQMAV